jgi:hypothetical protein
MSMDWSLLIGSISLVVASVTAYFYLHSLVTQTRKEFRDSPPSLRITNLSAMTSADVLTLYPEIENIGKGVAYDCVMTMDGWKGQFAAKKVYPPGPRFQRFQASIILGPDAPIRASALEKSDLRLHYRDRWGQKHECWYPVIQLRDETAAPPHNIQVDLEHPGMTEPTPSFWEMRKFLRNISLYD